MANNNKSAPRLFPTAESVRELFENEVAGALFRKVSRRGSARAGNRAAISIKPVIVM
jgi:hypothetical protein